MDGGAENAAQTRSKMQGWKMRDRKIEHQKCRAEKCEKNEQTKGYVCG